MNNESDEIGKEKSWLLFGTNHSFVERLKKATKNLSHDIRHS
jgi:hypothetical protein